MKSNLLNYCFAILLFSQFGCHDIYNKRHPDKINVKDTTTIRAVNVADTTKKQVALAIHTDSLITPIRDTLPNMIKTGNLPADSVITFAKTLIGTRYKYGSSDPAVGFDCSGFFTYVFNHFKIKVPRASREFEFSGTAIPLPSAKKGDLILFTGTDSTERFIGHMGLVLNNDNGAIQFIHSSSGKAYSVTISPLDKYYMGRFLKIIRIFSR